ncbi:MAG: ATP-binding protein [Chitinophagales bacterium]|nr:ATP-binding protein [Chitinophagales bacterium]
MKLNFKQRLFIIITVIFTVSTIGIALFEQSRERANKTEALEEKLDVYVGILNASIHQQSHLDLNQIDSIVSLMPSNLRVSLIDKNGTVLYDNTIEDVHVLGNHAQRTEIVALKSNDYGTDIRNSVSNNEPYLYYAKAIGGYFIRVALPYNIQTKNFLKPDNTFLYFILLIYLTVLFLTNYVIGRFGNSLTQLRDFAVNTQQNLLDYNFGDDELGEIGKKLSENFKQLEQSKDVIHRERDRLLQHIHNSKEGICFYTSQNEVEFYNGHFIQYIHLITDSPEGNPSIIFTDSSFVAIQQFINQHDNNFLEFKINIQGKTIAIRAVRFENNGFEVILNDITQQEKTRILKQEMTGNIAHELRTPVTGIRGYLETILNQPLEADKQRYFIEKAFGQTQLLSELIQDMSLISKIEEAGHTFVMQSIQLYSFLENLKEEYALQLSEKQVDLTIDIPNNCSIKGNSNLLNSIFKNLIDNALRYAGDNINIVIRLYEQDAEFYYFSFYDTGKGIENENQLSRLFERFYRVNEGRTRDMGGSGLGLAIVKNAIQIHGGNIYAKNRKEGGLEFIFQLRKA